MWIRMHGKKMVCTFNHVHICVAHFHKYPVLVVETVLHYQNILFLFFNKKLFEDLKAGKLLGPEQDGIDDM